jgi:hypothetical protein
MSTVTWALRASTQGAARKVAASSPNSMASYSPKMALENPARSTTLTGIRTAVSAKITPATARQAGQQPAVEALKRRMTGETGRSWRP